MLRKIWCNCIIENKIGICILAHVRCKEKQNTENTGIWAHKRENVKFKRVRVWVSYGAGNWASEYPPGCSKPGFNISVYLNEQVYRDSFYSVTHQLWWACQKTPTYSIPMIQKQGLCTSVNGSLSANSYTMLSNM